MHPFPPARFEQLRSRTRKIMSRPLSTLPRRHISEQNPRSRRHASLLPTHNQIRNPRIPRRSRARGHRIILRPSRTTKSTRSKMHRSRKDVARNPTHQRKTVSPTPLPAQRRRKGYQHNGRAPRRRRSSSRVGSGTFSRHWLLRNRQLAHFLPRRSKRLAVWSSIAR